MKTVGELKDFIKNLPDDMPLVKYESDMEASGYRNDVYCSVDNMKEETKETWDRFDYTSYSYQVMVDSDDGIPCLKIY